jgi:ribulose-phosphate 3-epimerase
MAKIIPAILTKNLSDLKNKLEKIKTLTDWVQIDIMDGRFVKNISVSLTELKKIRFTKNLEIHLMVFNPERYFLACQRLKAKRVIFHFEATKNPSKVLKEMEKYQFEKGMALNPETKIEKIKPYLNQLDLVLFLGVNPGFQGQKFNSFVLRKIKKLRRISKEIKIGVDGGINFKNIKKIAQLGVDYLVVGSYLFQSKNIKKAYQLLKREVQ